MQNVNHNCSRNTMIDDGLAMTVDHINLKRFFGPTQNDRHPTIESAEIR